MPLLNVILRRKSVLTGLFIAAASSLGAVLWVGAGESNPCLIIAELQSFAAQNHMIGVALFFLICLCLFFTVIPVGTALVLLAGFFFGPVAGVTCSDSSDHGYFG